MKRLQTALLFVLLFLLSTAIEAQQAGDIRGAYALVKQSINMGNGDSVLQNEQVKLFTDKYVIYAHKRQDTLASFGVGRYNFSNERIVENVFFNEEGAQKNTYELVISKNDEGYRQVINMKATDGKDFILTEDYKNLAKFISSPLDGAWKLVKVKRIATDGKTSVDKNRTQFKLYESGNFIWAVHFKDAPAGQRGSGFGYGTFEMTNDAKAMETNTKSSYSSIVDMPVTLHIKFVGKNKFEQSIDWPNGMKEKETYQRLK